MDGDKGYDEKLRRSYRHQTDFSTTKLYERNGGWRDHHGKTPRRKWLLVDFP